MRLAQLATLPNLRLAWRRITTGGNHQYKRLYRSLYYVYEIALEANLRDLRTRILGGAFTPQPPERMYVPKASGLHRPVTLLSIEDQIVLQAFANLAATRLQHRRHPLQFRVVFSNILQSPSSIFFFRRWQETYAAFQKRIKSHFARGRQWVGDFDLAAFYDTVSHELLMRTIYPRTNSNDLEWIKSCLKIWSSDVAAYGHGHGLPQGPLASDFLAECFLLPVDVAMRPHPGYVRYVDDVRLLGTTEDEVRSYLTLLERHCRERGLIPQTGKFAIKRAQTLEEAMGMLPSIADPQHEPGAERLTANEALATITSAIGGRPYRVTDKTRLRYALYRAPPDSTLLRLVLRLLPHHPEHTDAFFAFLARFDYRKAIEQTCRSLVMRSPYGYVRGEAWHMLARYQRHPRATVYLSPVALTRKAVDIAKQKTKESFAERWGVLHYLCHLQQKTGGQYSRFLKYQTPLLQALVGPMLPDAAYAPGEAVDLFLRRSNPEPGLAVCPEFPARRLTLSALGVTDADLTTQVRNTLQEMGVVSGPGPVVDPIATILRTRYGVPEGKSWHTLLGLEYVYALGLLRQAEAAFSAGRSFWLACQNSFNQTVFLALQRHFAAIGHAGQCTIVNKNGQLVDFGVTLEPTGPFSMACPSIGTSFRAMNTRRNRLPVSHPYEKKTAAQSEYLRAREQRQFVAKLSLAYGDLLTYMP